MFTRILLLSLIPLALGLAACGDDDDGSRGGPSKDAFIKKADAICQRGEDQSQRIVRRGFADPQSPQPQEVLTLIRKLVPVQRRTIEKVRALEMPPGDEDEINRFLTEAERATNQAAMIRDPQRAVEAVQASGTPADPFYEANRIAREYGFDACAE